MSGDKAAYNPLEKLQQGAGGHGGGHGGGTEVALNKVLGRKADEMLEFFYGGKPDDHGDGGGGGDHCDYKSWAGGTSDGGDGGHVDHHNGNISIVGGQDISSTAIGSLTPSFSPGGGGGREIE
jgi:hypothetical protein